MLNLNALDKPRKTRYLTGKDSAENFISRPRNNITHDLGLTGAHIYATRNAKGTVMTGKITRIRIPCRWRVDAVHIHCDVADFKLGRGPCGKNAVTLLCDITPDFVHVTQICETGVMERKDFYYPMAQITGRIEITRI